MPYHDSFPPEVIADGADLSRLDRPYAVPRHLQLERWDDLRLLGVADRVAQVRHDDVFEGRWHVVVLEARGGLDFGILGTMSRYEGGTIALVIGGEVVSGS